MFEHCFPKKASNLNITGKSLLITGGNSGIGRSLVEICASHKIKHVTILGRDKTTMEATCQAARVRNPDGIFEWKSLDLSSQVDIQRCVKEIVASKNDYDVIIGNAGLVSQNKKLTQDGHEWVFGINHLGHYSFIVSYLNSIPKENHPDRICLTSSGAHRFIKKEKVYQDYNSDDGSYSPMFGAYSRSKLANLHFSFLLAKKLPHIICTSTHPGAVKTSITRDANWFTNCLFGCLAKTAESGCQTMLWASFSDDSKILNGSGKYFENCRHGDLGKFAYNVDLAEHLWAYSERITQIKLKC